MTCPQSQPENSFDFLGVSVGPTPLHSLILLTDGEDTQTPTNAALESGNIASTVDWDTRSVKARLRHLCRFMWFRRVYLTLSFLEDELGTPNFPPHRDSPNDKTTLWNDTLALAIQQSMSSYLRNSAPCPAENLCSGTSTLRSIWFAIL